MTQHYTRNTVEASAWCKRCNKPTMHRIDGVKLGPCLKCMDRHEAPGKIEPRSEPAEEQLSLFGGIR